MDAPVQGSGVTDAVAALHPDLRDPVCCGKRRTADPTSAGEGARVGPEPLVIEFRPVLPPGTGDCGSLCYWPGRGGASPGPRRIVGRSGIAWLITRCREGRWLHFQT